MISAVCIIENALYNSLNNVLSWWTDLKIQIKELVYFFYFRIKFHCIRKGNKLYLKHVSVLIACPRVSRKPLTVIEGGRYY